MSCFRAKNSCLFLILFVNFNRLFINLFFIYYFVQAVLNAADIDMSARIVKGRFSSSHLFKCMTSADMHTKGRLVHNCKHQIIASFLETGVFKSVFSRKPNQRQFQHIMPRLSPRPG